MQKHTTFLALERGFTSINAKVVVKRVQVESRNEQM
jgi:hypothetical protein